MSCFVIVFGFCLVVCGCSLISCSRFGSSCFGYLWFRVLVAGGYGWVAHFCFAGWFTGV